VRNDEAAQLAEDAGLKVVMNRCAEIELFRPFWKPRLGRHERSFDITDQALASRHISPLARSMGHWLMAWLQVGFKRDFDRALQERQIALALSANDPIVIATMGQMAVQAQAR
jgi:hypothetical protein